MNLEQDILDVLRNAAEPLSNPEIREQLGEPADFDLSSAEFIGCTSRAIDQLIGAGRIERCWPDDSGRAKYLLAPQSAAATPTVHASALPASPIAPTTQFAPQPPPPQPEESAMPKTTNIQQKILDAIAKLGGEAKPGAICSALPKISKSTVQRAIVGCCEAGKLVAYGATAARRYRLAGHKVSAASESKPSPTKKKAPAARATTNPPAIEPVEITDAHLSLSDLRAAAAEILLSHGADSLPKPLHRLCSLALGEAA